MPLDHKQSSVRRPISKMASCGPGRFERKGIDLEEAISFFRDEEAATEWIEWVRWGDGPIICPKCDGERTRRSKVKSAPYWCKDCRRTFSVKTGTPMAKSKIPLKKWFFLAYLDLTNLKGIASTKLARDLGISQRAAWFMIQRLHETYMVNDPPPEFAQGGKFQLDEAYIGGKEKNKHKKDRIYGSQGGATKSIVICITHMKTKTVWTDVIPDTKAKTIQKIVERIIPKGSVLYTDDARHYEGIKKVEHHAVRHSEKEYTRIVELADGMVREVTTNNAESAWSMLKRAIVGVNHKISKKHLPRYVKAFAGRWNLRPLGTEDQMAYVFRQMIGKRVTYKELTADNGQPSGSRKGGKYYPERRGIRYDPSKVEPSDPRWAYPVQAKLDWATRPRAKLNWSEIIDDEIPF